MDRFDKRDFYGACDLLSGAASDRIKELYDEKIAVLGSTGSIGTQTLEVVRSTGY